MGFRISQLSPILGSEIRGIDLSQPVADEIFAEIETALNRTHVLVFRDQVRLAPAQQIAFSRRFGPLQIHVQRKFLLPGHPEILVVSNEFRNGEPIGLVDAGKYWHSDLSYMAEPSLGSLLHAQVLPKDGGDTLFVNMHAAYDALPEPVKQRIASLSAEHSYLARNAYQNQLHPERPALDAAQAASAPPCSSTRDSPPASWGSSATKAMRCCSFCFGIRPGRASSIAIVGSRTIWCSGTTARPCILPPAARLTSRAPSTARQCRATDREVRRYRAIRRVRTA
jgi:TfdA family taurine catabolism dioxygenase TauD